MHLFDNVFFVVEDWPMAVSPYVLSNQKLSGGTGSGVKIVCTGTKIKGSQNHYFCMYDTCTL